MTNTLRRALLKLCALVALGAAPASAATTVWNFTGTCLDCPDIGEGTLTAFFNGVDTLFTFTYASDWISYSMSGPVVSLNDGPAFRTGEFTMAAGDKIRILQAQVAIQSFGGPGNPLPAGVSSPDNTFFVLNSNGTWETGGIMLLDFGTNGAFTLQNSGAVPEPSTYALVGAALPLLGLAYRKRKKS